VEPRLAEPDPLNDFLARAGARNRSRTNDALEAFDQVRAMTWRLLNPKN
jgi:hypothetical protein